MSSTSWIIILLEGEHSLKLKLPKTAKPHTFDRFPHQHYLDKDWRTFLDNSVTFYLNYLKWLLQPSAWNFCYLLGFPSGTKTKFRQFLWQLSERSSASLATQVKGFLGGGGDFEKPPPLAFNPGQIRNQGCWPCCLGLMPWFTTAHKTQIPPLPESVSSRTTMERQRTLTENNQTSICITLLISHKNPMKPVLSKSTS